MAELLSSGPLGGKRDGRRTIDSPPGQTPIIRHFGHPGNKVTSNHTVQKEYLVEV